MYRHKVKQLYDLAFNYEKIHPQKMKQIIQIYIFSAAFLFLKLAIHTLRFFT